MLEIIKNEWKGQLRNRLMLFLGGFCFVITIWVTFLGQWQVERQGELYTHAKEHMREQWDGMGDTNPHNAVHFGTFAFKPYGFLSSIDEGVQAVTGNVIRLEGHVQNEMTFPDASRSLTVSYFGKLKPALILQYLVPLLLIFVAFSSVSSEKESGRIRLLLVQGLSAPKIIFGKTLAVATIGWLILTMVLAITLLGADTSISQDETFRLILLFVAYLVFYFLLVLLTVCLSAIFKSATASLSAILALWVLWVICIPIVIGTISEEIHPLPSRRTFKTEMEHDRHQGINGHNPSGERQKAFTDSLLAVYNVEEKSQLPVNADGLIMQADEEYGNMVWDKHFGKNDTILNRQKRTRQLMGAIDPFMALQHLSMGLSGNDLLHAQDFQVKAEHYRREIIKAMNDEHAYGGSKTGDWSWKAKAEFYQSIPEYTYGKPKINTILDRYYIDIAVLVFWTFLVVLLVTFFAPKLKLE